MHLKISKRRRDYVKQSNSELKRLKVSLFNNVSQYFLMRLKLHYSDVTIKTSQEQYCATQTSWLSLVACFTIVLLSDNSLQANATHVVGLR